MALVKNADAALYRAKEQGKNKYQIVFSFETEVLGETLELLGRIAWNREWDEGIHQYGVEFTIHERKRTHLIKLLNDFSLQLQKSPLVPACRFIRSSKYHFFKEAPC